MIDDDRLTHLQRLEAEAIHIMREVVAEFRKPVMLYSIGKDSSVMLHLAIKAFYPSKPPFPLLHVDTGWKFREMLAFRDETAARLAMPLIVHRNEAGTAEGVTPFTHGAGFYTHLMKTEALKQALDAHGFDAAFGGARRDEEKSRAKERIFSFRSENHSWDPKNQRPELWNLYNGRIRQGESVRVFPLSNWTELDVWQYILAENIPIVPLYLARERPVVERNGQLIMVDDDRLPLEPGEVPDDAPDPLPHTWLLSADGSHGILRSEPSRDRLRDALGAQLGTLRTADRPRCLRLHGEEEARGLFLMDNTPFDPAAFKAYLARHETKDLLRFLTCGSVDDGKSTLIGRLLHDTQLLFDDQLASLERDSRKHGTTGTDIDFALLLDGLEAEREQGITIDVAYRFFATDRRKFIVADTPGHEQYTRNMVTGASTADLAVILIDARKGVLTQTRRHSYIAALLGIRHVVLAVNKIDLLDYAQPAFEEIVADYRDFATELGFQSLTPIPLSARFGDNVSRRSSQMPWYEGPTLLEHLETVDVTRDLVQRPFRMPVQWVNRPDLDFRGYAGTIAGGRVEIGDRVSVASSGMAATVKSIVTYDGERSRAIEGEAVTLVLAEAIDISRGDILCDPAARPEVADQLVAHLVWMHQEPLVPGRLYLFKIGTRTVVGSVTEIKHTIDVNTFQHLAAKSLQLNDVALVNLSFREPIPFDPYDANHQTGGFIVIDRLNNQTVGAGMIDFALRRASNIHWQATELNKVIRGEALGQRPGVIWFTGLSGAGKSTIANLLEKRLFALGCHTYLIDGDNVRHGLNRDLGFTEADRVENIRRVAETARLFVDAGLIVLVSLISPYRSERRMARELLEPGEFVEVFVDTPLAVAEQRDPKGLYKKARAGLIKNFTGIDSPYEPPEQAELVLAASRTTPEQLVETIVDHLRREGFVPQR